MDLHHPHDSFFRQSLANLQVAKDLLQAHLSPELIKRIDWDTVKLTNKSYVTQELNQLHSDVVYSCQIDGKAAYIYCLIEHQSKAEPLLPFRILEYNVRMLREHLSQGNSQLPVVVNLVLYSGKKSPYPYSVDIYDCFEDPVLARAMMFKPLDLIDLGQLREEELLQHGTADLLELLLKQSHKRTFLSWMKAHPELMIKLLKRYYGVSGIVYILGVEHKHSAEELIEALAKIQPNKKEDIMTAAQQLMQQGRQEGMQEGMQQGEHNKALGIARNLLRKNMDVSFITETTGLDKKTITKLKEDK